MAGEEVVGIDVVARLDQFQKEMAKIPGIGADQARALAREMKKEIGEAGKASRAAAQEAKKLREAASAASSSAKDAADRFGDAGSIAGKFAQSLALLSPALGASAQLVADMADGAEGAAQAQEKLSVSTGRLLVVWGPVVAAVAAAAAIYRSIQLEIERTNSLRAFERELAQSLTASAKSLTSAQDNLRLATGALSEVEAGNLAIRREAHGQVMDYGDSLRSQRAELYETIIANESWADSQQALARGIAVVQGYLRGQSWDEIRDDAKAIEETFDALTGWRGAVDDAKLKLERLGDAEEEHARRQKEIRELNIATASATRSKTAADEAAKKMLEDLNRAGAEAATRATEQREAYYGAIDALMAQEQAARAALATERERIDLAYQAAQATAEAERDRALIIAQTVAAAETVEEQHRATSLALEEEYYAKLDTLRASDAKAAADAAKAAADAAKASRDAQMKQVDQAISYGAQAAGKLSDGFSAGYEASADAAQRMTEQLAATEDSLTDAQRRALEERIAATKDAARRQFAAAKAAKIAEAVASTALAIINAIAQSPPPSPFGLAGAAIAGAAGAAQVAAIASTAPAFHRGGPVDMRPGLAPDEVPATLKRGEFVVNDQGRSVLGDQALRDANAGRGARGGGMVVAATVYGHNTLINKWKGDGLALGDSIASAISGLKDDE